MNILILKGRLAADPEAHTTQSGKAYCNFTLAVQRPFTKETTDFIRCVAFGQKANFVADYFKKGQEILCRGSLQLEKYEKDGVKQTSASCKIDDVEFCGGKTNTSSHAQKDTSTDFSLGDFKEVQPDEGELPF